MSLKAYTYRKSILNITADIETTQGTIHINFFPEEAPMTVANFANLVCAARCRTTATVGLAAVMPPQALTAFLPVRRRSTENIGRT